MSMVLAAVTVLLALVAAPASAAPSPWSKLTRPWSTAVAVKDIAAFPPAGVVLAGGASRVALSVDGGVSWAARGPDIQGSEAELMAVDFRDSAHGGVVGSDGLLLITSDGGRSWRSPTIQGGPPNRDLLDVDLAGSYGYAVGAAGTLLATTDGGNTWVRVPAPAYQAITTVATDPSGNAVGGTDGGSLITGSGSSWSISATVTQSIRDVVASSEPAWGDSWPDLLVSLGASTLLGSTDGESFGWTLDSAAGPWPAMAWAGEPSGDVLLAGMNGAVNAVDGTSTPTAVVTRTSTGIGDAVAAAAPGGQSVAYVLGADGRVARTLSAAKRMATLDDPPGRITAGTSATLDSTVQIAAPGAVRLEGKVPGGSWNLKRSVAWTTASSGRASFSVSPILNASYRLRFTYGGRTSLISDATSVVKVVPKVTPERLAYDLKRGTVYRFSGTVYPALTAETVQIYTNRGGSWHKLDIGGTVKIGTNGAWTSRRFGTPIRESYRLRAYVKATARHPEAWSSVATVTIR
jgi:hypothetical protein